MDQFRKPHIDVEAVVIAPLGMDGLPVRELIQVFREGDVTLVVECLALLCTELSPMMLPADAEVPFPVSNEPHQCIGVTFMLFGKERQRGEEVKLSAPEAGSGNG